MSNQTQQPDNRLTLAIASIRTDFQPPECLDIEIVCVYAEKLRASEPIDPLAVQFDGQVYWLGDGFHRLAAAQSVGRESIEVEVVHGTDEEMEAE
jgi:uncharacterized ParB-like nuclease family protein